MQARRCSLHCLQLLVDCACARFCALKTIKTVIISEAKIRMFLSSPLSFCAAFAQRFKMAFGVLPADHLHKIVDVTGGFRAKVHVIGVLVHVERQDRRAAGQIHELAIAW
jgi:hypothetical protein